MKKFAKVFILLAALIWGTSFFIMKESLQTIPVFHLIAVRFSVAAILLSVFFWKKRKVFSKGAFLSGAAMGGILFLAYAAQTAGLTQTTPGKSAFLTAAHCIMVPFLYWAIGKKRPGWLRLAAAVFCIAGVGLVALDAELAVSAGDLLTLLGAFFFALHMVAVSRFSEKWDIYLLTSVQFACAAVLSLLCAVFFEASPAFLNGKTLVELLYLGVFCTALALLLQNIGQVYTHPSLTALLLSLESVFGVLFSVLFYGERPTVRVLWGFAAILLALVLSEAKGIASRFGRLEL